MKTIVHALAVADRQREVTRSFSKKEQRQADQTSTLLEVLVAVFPLFELSSITPVEHNLKINNKFSVGKGEKNYKPDVQTDDERSESHWRSTFCKAARSEEGSKWLHLSMTAAHTLSITSTTGSSSRLVIPASCN